jgi:hypothetical protein
MYRGRKITWAVTWQHAETIYRGLQNPAVVPTKEQETKKTTSRVFNLQCVLGKQGKTKKSPSLAHLSAWFYILNKPLAHSPTA